MLVYQKVILRYLESDLKVQDFTTNLDPATVRNGSTETLATLRQPQALG